MNVAEILTKAGLNTVLGMGIVFAVLILLAFLIFLIKYIPALLGITSEKEKAEEIEDEMAVAALAGAIMASEDCTDDLELVAVITAAIAASEGTSTDGFVVRSIRRRQSNKWR